MREQGFVDLEQSPLVVHEQVKNVSLVLAREVTNFDSVLRKLSESKETFLKLFGFIRTLVKLLKLLSVVDLVLEAAFHDLLSDLLDALDK